MAEAIKEILEKYLQKKSFKEINQTIALEKEWEEVVGKHIYKNTQIVSFKKGVLKIKSATPVWRNEISLQKEIILKKINKQNPKQKIKEIQLI